MPEAPTQLTPVVPELPLLEPLPDVEVEPLPLDADALPLELELLPLDAALDALVPELELLAALDPDPLLELELDALEVLLLVVPLELDAELLEDELALLAELLALELDALALAADPLLDEPAGGATHLPDTQVKSVAQGFPGQAGSLSTKAMQPAQSSESAEAKRTREEAFVMVESP